MAEAEITYKCPAGKVFDLGGGNTANTQISTCNWDGSWTSVDLTRCVGRLERTSASKNLN